MIYIYRILQAEEISVIITIDVSTYSSLSSSTVNVSLNPIK